MKTPLPRHLEKRSPGEDQDPRSLAVLEALALDPELSQRELAQRAGLSLTKAHFVLRDLIHGGLVQVQSSRRSNHRLGYVYQLTLRGRDAYARLKYLALARTVQGFRRMAQELEASLGELHRAGVREVGLLGEGPLQDCLRELIQQGQRLRLVDVAEAPLVLVCDIEAEQGYSGRGRLLRFFGAGEAGATGRAERRPEKAASVAAVRSVFA